jgi:hypothetical protein
MNHLISELIPKPDLMDDKKKIINRECRIREHIVALLNYI